MRTHISYAMTQCLAAWTPKADLNRHAVAHGVSPSGLYRALVKAKLITPKPKKASAAEREQLAET